MGQFRLWLSEHTSNEIGDLVVVLVCLAWATGVLAGYLLKLAEQF